MKKEEMKTGNTACRALRAACILSLVAAALAAVPASAETVVHVKGTGAEKIPVSVDVGGEPSFAASLRKNLDLSGVFKVVKSGAVKVSGSVGSAVKAEGAGKVMTLPSTAADAKAARMEARRLADKMVETYGRQRGFACDRIAFVTKKGKDVSELCACYPDGYDIVQLTSAGGSVVGPRWGVGDRLLYTAIRNAGPQVFEYNAATRREMRKWSFKGLSTGATVAPDGRRVAIILSMHGNPELYIIDTVAGTWTRLTTTPYANEGQPSWSPDGKSIVFVSDESRKPHLYVIDVTTRKRTLLTKTGAQNVDPDWGPDNRIVYVTKRSGGSQVAVIDMDGTDRTPKLVGEPGTWEHPSWARDGRHVAACRDGALFVVDTTPPEKGGEPPKQLFRNPGKWITPTWRR